MILNQYVLLILSVVLMIVLSALWYVYKKRRRRKAFFKVVAGASLGHGELVRLGEDGKAYPANETPNQ